MDKLIEMVQIARAVKISPGDILFANSSSKTNVQAFYQGLLDGQFKSDQEAARLLFNENSTSSKYKNLKRYLKQKIYNTIFFVEPGKEYGEFNEVYLFSCKKLFIAKILMNLGARNSGIEICLKVFKKAKQVELTEFLVETSRYLRLHYGSRVGDLKKFEYYNDFYNYQSEVLKAERKAEEYYVRLALPLVKSILIDEEMIGKVAQFYQELKPDLDKYESPILHFYGKYIKILQALFQNDYQKLISDCVDAIEFFENKTYTYANPVRVFYHNLLIGYTQLKMYPEGKEAAEKASKLVASGTHSWYANKELHLILAFHSKEYDEVLRLIDLAFSHTKFRLLDPIVKEKWSIYQAYAYFLITITPFEIKEQSLKQFKLGKFLNNIPVYSQDKRGLNIPILILQIAIMIARKEYSKTIDRFDAIKKYVFRHVKKKQNFRSYCFINMLLVLPASSFNKTAVLRKSQSWYEQLKNTPLEIANQSHEIEIVPYEDLWNYILDGLDNRFH